MSLANDTIVEVGIGCDPVLTIPLTENGAAYSPPAGSTTSIYFKNDAMDADASAVLTLASSGGTPPVVVGGSTAVVTVPHANNAVFLGRDLFFWVVRTVTSDLRVHTVATGYLLIQS